MGSRGASRGVSRGVTVPKSFEVDGYEMIKDIGSGNFGVAWLARKMDTGETVAVKFIERGENIDENVQREIINHRQLQHRNVIAFRSVALTSTHLAIIMEYAAGGELFQRVCSAGKFGEPEARYFFQQLVSGVDYCHRKQIVHRDLKLENALLTNDKAPRLKICDFGYSKSGLLHSQPKSTVGTPAYIAPEVLQRKEYDGKQADVWSCGVTLYVMLVGQYPFEDPQNPRNFKETLQRIMQVKYSYPQGLRLSNQVKDLLSKIFVADATKRITLAGVRNHPWFLTDLPADLFKDDAKNGGVYSTQSVEEITRVVTEAMRPASTHEINTHDIYGDVEMDADGEIETYMEDSQDLGQFL